jgi:hypothetical protein
MQYKCVKKCDLTIRKDSSSILSATLITLKKMNIKLGIKINIITS